ncbi:MAG: UDP-N-acetylmuramate--L-alanine ligase [Chloroflexota bacterium]
MLKVGDRVHFIGIAGSGLSAMARVLSERGILVSGSDRNLTSPAKELMQLGIKVVEGHHAENIGDATLVIRSSAIPDNNVEVQAAKARGIPVLKRVDFLKDLIGNQRTIAVAGTHGKTTTTAMCAWVFTQLHLDPSYIIGGTSVDLGGNAHAGGGEYFVIEADEYDGMFHGLTPYIAVITNIEYDHPDCYPTRRSFEEAFYRFAGQVVENGKLVLCAEDEGTRKLGADLGGDAGVVYYGWGDPTKGLTGDYRAHRLTVNSAGGFDFEATRGENLLGKVSLKVAGEHNVLNALAVLAICDQLKLTMSDVIQALNEFHGTSRRFEVRGLVNDVILIDDYAHHPSEIQATLKAAKAKYAGWQIWAVWQPHTYSRTTALWQDFREAFQAADRLIVLDVFGARETQPAGFSMKALTDEIYHAEKSFCPSLEEACQELVRIVQPKSVIVVLSAGDANRLYDLVQEELEKAKVHRDI